MLEKIDNETKEQIEDLLTKVNKVKNNNVDPILVTKEQSEALEALVVSYMTAASTPEIAGLPLINALDKVWDNIVKVEG